MSGWPLEVFASASESESPREAFLLCKATATVDVGMGFMADVRQVHTQLAQPPALDIGLTVHWTIEKSHFQLILLFLLNLWNSHLFAFANTKKKSNREEE